MVIGSLWLKSCTIVRFSPGSFMAGKSVGEIENTVGQVSISLSFLLRNKKSG